MVRRRGLYDFLETKNPVYALTYNLTIEKYSTGFDIIKQYCFSNENSLKPTYFEHAKKGKL